jgi:phosphatidylserine/phosphatidylglycerophosphate/cardiolipin synthase-like enzyme
MTTTITIHTTPGWASALAYDISQAEKSILIAALSGNAPTGKRAGPMAALWRELLAAPSRGVVARLVLPAPQTAHPATWANMTSATKAHAAGVHTVLIPGARLWHAKAAVIDDRIAWVGSGNLTDAAAVRNVEIWTRMNGAELATDLLDIIFREAEISGRTKRRAP